MEQVESRFESRFLVRAASSGILPGMAKEGVSSPAAIVDAPDRFVICEGL